MRCEPKVIRAADTGLEPVDHEGQYDEWPDEREEYDQYGPSQSEIRYAATSGCEVYE